MNLAAILKGRCPRCRRGGIFRPGLAGWIFLNDECPVCGLPFMREAGYFLGAMYVSYALGVVTVLPVAVILAVAFDWPLAAVLTIMVLQTVVSGLIFLRYSRIIWLHVDQLIDPSPAPDKRHAG